MPNSNLKKNLGKESGEQSLTPLVFVHGLKGAQVYFFLLFVSFIFFIIGLIFFFSKIFLNSFLIRRMEKKSI